jgi:7-cyano-7-deazaguanine reductase
MTDYSNAASVSTDSMPDADLTVFPAPWLGDQELQVVFPEFRHECPVSGRPDHGTLEIAYRPRNMVCEEKSLRDFLYSFDGCAVWHSEAVAAVADALQSACEPQTCRVEAEFEPRGNMTTTVTAFRMYDE